jgi:predicted ester cyclase
VIDRSFEMTTEDNKAVVRRFYQAFEANDQEALKEVLAPELVAYNPNPQNREEHLQGIRGWHAMFSENRFEFRDQIAEGDRVASHVIMRCIHSRASFQGVPPSGKSLEIGAVTLERIKDGKIVERSVYSDRMGMLRQLGLLPPS